jgi:hypothetical protein
LRQAWQQKTSEKTLCVFGVLDRKSPPGAGKMFKDNPAWPFGRMRPVRKKRYPADLPPAKF